LTQVVSKGFQLKLSAGPALAGGLAQCKT